MLLQVVAARDGVELVEALLALEQLPRAHQALHVHLLEFCNGIIFARMAKVKEY